MDFRGLNLEIAPKIVKITKIENEDYRRRIYLQLPPAFERSTTFIPNEFEDGDNVVLTNTGEYFEIVNTTWGKIDCFISVLPEYDNIKLNEGDLIAPLVQWENKYDSSQIVDMINNLDLFCDEIRRLYKITETNEEILKAFGLC